MPNVEVNRRAEGTSELNRRLGAVEKGAVALERCGAAGDYGRGWAGWQAACCAVALQESELDAPVPLLEGQASRQQPGSVAGARGPEAPKGHMIVRDAAVRQIMNSAHHLLEFSESGETDSTSQAMA